MRFDDRFLEELKARLRPSDIIGRTVKLKRQGREYVGLSPFTKEKSPSFFVNDDKGFFHDFSSGKHGDVISFLQETERLSFVEAVQRLAGEAGMALPAEDPQSVLVGRRTPEDVHLDRLQVEQRHEIIECLLVVLLGRDVGIRSHEVLMLPRIDLPMQVPRPVGAGAVATAT